MRPRSHSFKIIHIVTYGETGMVYKLSWELFANWGGLSLLINAKRSRLSLNSVCSRLPLNTVSFERIAQRREKNIEINISSWTWPARLLTDSLLIQMKMNRRKKILYPIPIDPPSAQLSTNLLLFPGSILCLPISYISLSHDTLPTPLHKLNWNLRLLKFRKITHLYP